jgi:hypothetical protein
MGRKQHYHILDLEHPKRKRPSSRAQPASLKVSTSDLNSTHALVKMDRQLGLATTSQECMLNIELGVSTFITYIERAFITEAYTPLSSA